MFKKVSKRNLYLILSLLSFSLFIVILFIGLYPKSAKKGYIEAYRIYLSSDNNIDLLNLYLEEEYPLEGIFESKNLSIRKEIYAKIIAENEKKIESEEYSRKVANNMIKDGLEITEIVVKEKFENIIFTEFTAMNNNSYDVRNVVFQITFYDNGKLIKTKNYEWDGKFPQNEDRTMTTSAGEYQEYDEAKVEIVSFGK